MVVNENRRSQKDIDRKIPEAKEFEEQDKEVRAKVETKNKLEQLVFSLKNLINDEDKLGGKLTDADKYALENAVKGALAWLDQNPSADTEEYEEQLQQLQSISHPIISSVYQQQGDSTEEQGEVFRKKNS